jgi:ubiquinone/menaquinone biosynthesis C-methylase UbiE
MDQAAMKAKELDAWTKVAPGWKKHDQYQRTISAVVSERMIAAAGIAAGQRVLDIASGTGEPAIPIAERVGAKGRVLGLDFVEDMLAFAREKAAAKRLHNVEFKAVDGESFAVPPASFDIATMRWGLMFMPDPEACLRRIHQALVERGKVVLACWAGPERNPWAAIPMGVFKRLLNLPAPPPGATGLFAFADPNRIRTTLENSGFSDVRIEPVEVQMADFASGADYFTWVRELAGPVAGLYTQLHETQRPAVAAEIAQEAQRQSLHPKRLRLNGVTWVAVAEKRTT